MRRWRRRPKWKGAISEGRPSYGHRLADAGPHPNLSKAADGKRLHRLEPDPDTAPVPRSVYVREELIVEPLDEWLATAFDPTQFADTVRAMADSQLANDHRLAAVEVAREGVTECERKLVSCRAALDAGTDPAVVAGWITETGAKRKVEQIRLDQAMSKIPKGARRRRSPPRQRSSAT